MTASRIRRHDVFSPDSPAVLPPRIRRNGAAVNATGSGTSNATPRNTHRQDTSSVSIPATSGPTTDGSTHNMYDGSDMHT